MRASERQGGKVIVCLLVLFLMATWLAFIPGCGGKKEQDGTVEDAALEETPGEGGEEVAPSSGEGAEGEGVDVPADEAAGEGQVGEGEVSYQVYQEAPSEDELGAPIYPGAAYVPESGGSVSGVAPEGEFTTVGGEFRTQDPFGLVLAWYRERLGEPLFLEESQSTATWSRREGGNMVLVGLRGEASGTTISIYNLQGSEELLP
ncbi:MAG: hypothetical protein H5T73_08585 [Actinobacteria bacterium]|nr:hypothetical protein [Actinomycetota bacterium]